MCAPLRSDLGKEFMRNTAHGFWYLGCRFFQPWTVPVGVSLDATLFAIMNHVRREEYRRHPVIMFLVEGAAPTFLDPFYVAGDPLSIIEPAIHGFRICFCLCLPYYFPERGFVMKCHVKKALVGRWIAPVLIRGLLGSPFRFTVITTVFRE